MTGPHPVKITFGEMREMGVPGVLIYCGDHRCSTQGEMSAAPSRALPSSCVQSDLTMVDAGPKVACAVARAAASLYSKILTESFGRLAVDPPGGRAWLGIAPIFSKTVTSRAASRSLQRTMRRRFRRPSSISMAKQTRRVTILKRRED